MLGNKIQNNGRSRAAATTKIQRIEISWDPFERLIIKDESEQTNWEQVSLRTSAILKLSQLKCLDSENEGSSRKRRNDDG